MVLGIFVLILLFLAGLLLISSILKRLQLFGVETEEPVRLPKQMGWILLLIVAALNIGAYDTGFGIGYGLFGVGIFAGILWSFPREKLTVEAWFLGVTGIVACLLFGFRSNDFVQVMNVVAAVLCMGSLILLRSFDTIRWHGLWIIKMKLGFLARILHRPFGLGGKKNVVEKSARPLVTILVTAGLTLAILLFFSTILSSADPVFDALVKEVRDQALGRTLFSGIVVMIVLLLVSVRIPGKWQERVPQFTVPGFIEIFVPAVSLALLFALFLFVQAKYLFASHADFQSFNITYADYVRQGFIELLVASFVGSALTYAIILKQHALTDRAKVLKLQWVNGVLLIELLLLVLSAAKRDWMYVEIYGLTRVRFIGGVFLAWLCGIILLIAALNCLRKMNERRLFQGGAILSVLVVLFLNGRNIDHRIAFSPTPGNQRADIVYMTRLSPDAIHGWIAATAEAEMLYESLRTQTTFAEEQKQALADSKIAMTILDKKIGDLMLARKWQEWNWSESYAKGIIGNENGLHIWNMVRCVLRGIGELQMNTKTDLYQQESRTIYDYYSPFMFNDIPYYPDSLEYASENWKSVPIVDVPESCANVPSTMPDMQASPVRL